MQRYNEVAGYNGNTTDKASGNASNDQDRGLSLGQLLQNIRDIAVSKNKIVETSLIEQLLSISFAAGNLDAIEEVDDTELAAALPENVTSSSDTKNTAGDGAEYADNEITALL